MWSQMVFCFAEPGMNLAIFKLRFLLPLSFRGMVTVDKKTGDISMNPTFQKFVLMPEGKLHWAFGDNVRRLIDNVGML